MPETQACVLCGKMVPLFEIHPREDARIVNCRTCGRFAIEKIIIEGGGLGELKDKLYHLSALTKASTDLILIDRAMVKRLIDGQFADLTIRQKIDTIVRWVADQSREPGQKIRAEAHHNYPVAVCKSESEWRHIHDYAIQLAYLGGNTDETFVTLKGWDWLTARPNATSSTAFIAMCFGGHLNRVRDAIMKGIADAGYRPVIVNREEYVGGVMDQVIALIRESRFVVADFTENRGGVYYEAGFGRGLGITVINTCSQVQLDSTDKKICLHFDVHHLNFVAWDEAALDDFSTRLTNRIVAVLERGPIRPH